VISWLLWLLGFSVSQVGNTSRTADAVDIVATTPSGNFVLVECTIGLLRADHKLANLYERTQRLRDRLAASNISSPSILPVIVTSKSRAHVTPDIEQAERTGIYVITREDVIQAIDRTLVLINTDQLYQKAFQAMQAAQSRALARVTSLLEGDHAGRAPSS
jgi:hypothetical protein